MTLDEITAWMRGLLKAGFIQYPTRSSFGIMLGTVASYMLQFLQPSLPPQFDWKALTGYPLPVTGLLVFNIPTVFGKGLPESVEQRFHVLRKTIEEGKIPVAHQRMLYIQLAKDVLAEYRMNVNIAGKLADEPPQEG